MLDEKSQAEESADSEPATVAGETIETEDDPSKNNKKVNMFSLAFNAGTAVVTGISMILLWVLPQQKDQQEVKKTNQNTCRGKLHGGSQATCSSTSARQECAPT